ncbi:MAG: hypothetical protein Q7U91_02025 [Sideroxyarcus sp.]|nr:hypothetical protein [Sideroxyarcus sp.]
MLKKLLPLLLVFTVPDAALAADLSGAAGVCDTGTFGASSECVGWVSLRSTHPTVFLVPACPAQD